MQGLAQANEYFATDTSLQHHRFLNFFLLFKGINFPGKHITTEAHLKTNFTTALFPTYF